MGTFSRALRGKTAGLDSTGRQWVFVSYDQLTDAIGPLARIPVRELGIVLVECPSKAARRPYHKQKLALVLTSLRHFAIEQAERGVAVRHVVSESYREALGALGPLSMMRPAERELRAELAPLVESGQITLLDHDGWLTTASDFQSACPAPPYRMDAFYRFVRRKLGVLMEKNGKPVGGRFSFDTENRRTWKGEPPAPKRPRFAVDAITEEVCELVRTKLKRHPGALDPEALPATKADVERVWQLAKDECLDSFGPFEDAMASDERHLFHTLISPLLNLQRLPVRRVIDEVVAMKLPLPSKEGFIRQILGWREYMRHVHEATDGFRVIGGIPQPCAKTPGDGGHGGWSGESWPAETGDGGSMTSVLGASNEVPPAWWGRASGLRCLDEVVRGVWEEGYSHHITRLMVLSNIAMLLDVSPRALADWFWVAYIDAYDWVVEPNVHGMSTFGVGDLLTTKPYVAGAGYIDRMSDFCQGCSFDPKTTCPLTPMYWAFLSRHRETLAKVDRMKLPLVGEARRSPAQKETDEATFKSVRDRLARGEQLGPNQRSLF